MTTKTTTHLIITTRDLLAAHVRAYLAQRDPLALGSLAIVGLVLALAIGRAGVLAIAGAFPTLPAAAQPTVGPIILIATAQPPAAPTVPTADALRLEVESLRARVAELEQQPTAEPQLVYVEQQQPAPPVVEPMLIAPTPEPPEPTAAPAPTLAPEQLVILDRQRWAEQAVGGSGKSRAPDFGQIEPASDDAAARWCAAAASAGQAHCVEDQP